MVCDGPDPPDDTPYELNLPPHHDLLMNGPLGEDSDDEQNEVFGYQQFLQGPEAGYQPLPQGPEAGYQPFPQGPEPVHSDHEHSDDETENTNRPPNGDVPTIEPMEAVLTREVWNAPRPTDPIVMDNERAEQVMSAMANFALPQTSIPEWAQSITEEQWKQTLKDRIERMKDNP